jgi:hypothetical protein
MSANGSGSPVEYPTVKIGAETLTVKIGLLAELIISRAGLTFGEIITALLPASKDPRRFNLCMQLFAAAVAHNYPSGAVPTAEDWAQKVDALGGDPVSNLPILTAMFDGLSVAITKRWPTPLVHAGTSEGQLTPREREQRWLDLWAFATSPYGLGLSSEVFWSLTGRELQAFKLQWAKNQAQALNLQANTEGVPFIPEDFLGLSDRVERVAEHKAKMERAEAIAAMENFKNEQLRMGIGEVPDDGVPEWMKKAAKKQKEAKLGR